MDRIVTIKEAAELLYGEPTKSRCNIVRRQCVDGTIRNCDRLGTKWYINATREWPHLFGKAEPEPAPATPLPQITGDTTVKELMGTLAEAAKA